MSLIICPDCGHEISTNAASCPNCGYRIPVKEPVIVRRVVESDRSKGTPYWLIIPAVTVVALLVIIFAVMMRNNDDSDGRNVNVDLARTRTSPSPNDSRTRTVDNVPPSQVTVPPSTTTVNPPATNPPSEPVQRTDVPGTSTNLPPSQPTRGVVKIEARVTTRDGKIQTVRDEKFYLLDEDLESILSEADLDGIEGNSLTNSFGLAVLYPDRYGDFHRRALEAIKKHIKYSGQTDAGGKAAIKDVKPEMYYLFGITKSRNGFAVWSSPVTINAGENILNLTPASINEISE